MERVFVRELKPYSVADIAKLMGADTDDALRVVERLLANGVMRYRTGSAPDGTDLPEEDTAGTDELYQFNWVGLALVEDWIFVCYPKYLRADGITDKDIERRMRLILRVFRRQAGASRISQMTEEGLRSSDRLPVMLRLLDLFDEYGEYSNYELTYEVNGSGVIDWNRTVNGHLPFLSNGRPVYTELETRKTRRNEADFIMRLHRAVLTECSRLLTESGVGEMLGLSEIWLSDEEIEDLGDAEVLAWHIGRERGVQFVTWKQDVLDAMALYLLDRKTSVRFEEVQSLGTSSFYHVWETACKVAFGDLLGKRLRQLPIALADGWCDKRDQTLLGIIPRPKWERSCDGGYVACGDVDTLIPDTVSFFDGADGKAFCIYDAKYYVPSGTGKMKGQPGVESVTKQFLYQRAYRDFVVDHGFSSVVNAFLVPGDVDAPQKMARVSFPGVLAKEEAPFSDHVDMWMLPAEGVYEAYLRGEKLDAGVIAMIDGVAERHLDAA